MEMIGRDLSKLLAIDEFVFNRLAHNANVCICDHIETSQLNNESTCSIDIGIGVLKIKIEDDTVRYKFVPSSELESGIVATLEDGQNQLKSVVSNRLINQLKSLYKEFI